MKYLFLLSLIFFSRGLYAQNSQGLYGIDSLIRTDSAGMKLDMHQYFEVHAKYPESSVALLKKVQHKMAASGKTFTGNGFITFRFLVDYKGQVSGFNLLQTDKNYHPATFDKELVLLLYSFITNLGEWPKARYNEHPVNYVYYLSFQIKNGTVVTVAP